ncbi:MAG: type II toxin-antitoxin system RelE/ParE family toxin [bacterium]|nr:type II toxin-antitoxin system RelE/ParE family toxin [bacterium]
MTFDFHPEAEAEFLAAISYYENCEPGLGRDFAMEVCSAIQNILSYPTAWPLLGEGIRRCLTHRFPYGVLFSIEPERVHILAVMHLHRNPDYWKQRR